MSTAIARTDRNLWMSFVAIVTCTNAALAQPAGPAPASPAADPAPAVAPAAAPAEPAAEATPKPAAVPVPASAPQPSSASSTAAAAASPEPVPVEEAGSVVPAETGVSESEPEPEPDADPLRRDKRPVDTIRFAPGKGLEFKSEDGDFSLKAGLRAQFLYQFRTREEEDRHAFLVRRARLSFAGNMWGATTYKVELAFSPRDVSRQSVDVGGMPDPAVTEDGEPAELATERDVVRTSPLLDWYVRFEQMRDLSLAVGQMKIPFSRQRSVSSGSLQFVDRALTNGAFTLDRDIGLDLFSSDLGGLGMLRYHAGIFIGEGRNSSDRTLGAGDSGFVYNARFEVLPLGDFKDYSEADHERSDAPRLALGVGYALLQSDATSPYADEALGRMTGGAEQTPVVDFTAHNFTADAVFKLSGLSAQTAFHLRDVAGLDGGNEGIGFLLAAGYLFGALPVEVAAQYALTHARTGSSLGNENELGAALSYYLAEHPLKVQLDLFQLWDGSDFSGGDQRLRVQLQAAL